MKVEFTNEELTRATVTRGWFRKRRAEVYFQPVRNHERASWRFVVGDMEVLSDVRAAIEHAQEHAQHERIWVRVETPPTARLVETED